MKTWNEYYKEIGWVDFISNNLMHFYYICKIILHRPKLLIEVGCGTGLHSFFISLILKKALIVCFDNDINILKKLKRRYYKYNKIVLVCGNALNIPFKKECFDVSYSQGVLEHYNEEEIKNILLSHYYISKNILISIPSEFYIDFSKDFGNEIPRTPNDYINIINRIYNYEIKKISVDYYKFEICPRTKYLIWKNLKGSFFSRLCKVLFFLPMSILICIEKK